MRRLLITLVLCLIALPVLAHDPSIEGDEDWGGFDAPNRVADATISYALYGYLDEGDIDVFRLDFEDEENLLRVELLVPVCGDHYADFYPHFAVFSTNTRAADSELAAVSFPFDVPEELHAVYVSDTPEATLEARPTFVEPIGGTAYYDSPRLDLDVPRGTYLIAVYAPDGVRSGDYTIATGYREVFNSPPGETLAEVITIRANAWLHRDCDLAPDDPNAMITPEHVD